MKKEIDNILEDYYQKRIDLLEARNRLLILFSNISNACFDSGFNISNERFNAEFRDSYNLFDEDDIKKYDQLKCYAVFNQLNIEETANSDLGAVSHQ